MDPVSDAGLRMQQIAAQLMALRTGGPGPTTASTSAATAGSATSSASFDAVLANAMSADSASSSADGSDTDPSADPASTSGLAQTPVPTQTALSALPSMAQPPAMVQPPAMAQPAAMAQLRALLQPTAAVAAPVAAAPTPAPPLAPVAPPSGALSPSGVPSDLAGYGNGRIPAALLEPLGVGDHKLWRPAAENFRAMRIAAARDGVQIGVNDSYRSYDQQVDMARRKGLYSQGGLAAAPGTSDHGWGKSVDLALDGRAQQWMATHASQYGFAANVRGESWHWTYSPT